MKNQKTNQAVKALKEKVMPVLIEEAIANGYTWDPEHEAQDYFSQFIEAYNTRVRLGFPTGAMDQEFIVWLQFLGK